MPAHIGDEARVAEHYHTGSEEKARLVWRKG